MTLIKTSLLSLISTIFKISYGLVLNKLLAVYVGPSGVALVGQFQSIQSGLSGIATAGFGQGLTKYLAEYRENTMKNSRVFATAVKLVCVFLLPVSLGLFLFSDEVATWLLGSAEYYLWMKGLALSLIPVSIGSLFLASLNGLGEIRSLTMVGVSSSCLGIVLSLVFVPLWGVSGVVFSLLSTPVLVLILSVWYLKQSPAFSWGWLKEKVHRDNARNLGKFTLMALASAVAVPVSHILIRNYLTDTVSLDAAGLWTGMWRISEAYLMVVTVTLGVYYLPKLSGLKSSVAIKKEIMQGQKIILPFVFLSALIIYLMRDWLIWLLFDDSFSDMKQLFACQLAGDVVKISSWLYGYVFIAKAHFKIFIFIELFFSTLFVVLTMMFVNRYGLVGVSYAFFVNYTLYLMFIYGWFQKSCKKGVFEEVME